MKNWDNAIHAQSGMKQNHFAIICYIDIRMGTHFGGGLQKLKEFFSWEKSVSGDGTLPCPESRRKW